MIDVQEIFERQARWQRSRAKLSWAEKLRMAETLRLAALMMGRRRISTFRIDLGSGSPRQHEEDRNGPSHST